MNPAAFESLPLRDIHLPPPPGFWPPAPGWWLLMLLLLLMAILLALFLTRKIRLRRRQRQLIALVERLAESPDDQPTEKLAQLSILLRRLALMRFPRSRVASLTGDDWLRFLDETGGNGGFTEGPGSLLADGPYMRELNDDSSRVREIANLARRWVLHNSGDSHGH